MADNFERHRADKNSGVGYMTLIYIRTRHIPCYLKCNQKIIVLILPPLPVQPSPCPVSSYMVQMIFRAALSPSMIGALSLNTFCTVVGFSVPQDTLPFRVATV